MEGRDTAIYKLSRLLVPVCELDECGREAMVGNAHVLRLAPAARLAAADDEAWLTYVVKGELAIANPDGLVELVPGGSGRARQPLFTLHRDDVHAEARTSSLLVRFDRTLFRSLLAQQRPRVEGHGINSQQLFARVYAAWCEHTLLFPPPPPALHLLYGVGAPNNLRALATLLRNTPEWGAEFVAAANRGPGVRQPARQPAEAMLQLGLAGARILALVLAAHRLHYVAGERPARLAQRQFRHDLLIGVLAYMLALRDPRLDPYRALTAGLVHDLGALLVPRYLADFPQTPVNDDTCAIAMRRLRTLTGSALLVRCGFDESLAQAAERAEHWHRHASPPGEAELLVVAHLIAAQEESAATAPALNRVPAFTRLCPRMTRQGAIELLRRATRLCASLQRRLT